MKIKCIAILLIALLFSCLTASAQSWLWGEQGNTGLKEIIYTSNVITNKTHNVYQTGGFEASITFRAYNLISPSIDFYLVKYDENGNVLWARQSLGDTLSFAAGYSVATDDSDNSYISGFAWDTVAFGSDTLYFPRSGQAFLIKYNASGDLMWAKQLDSSIVGNGQAFAVTTDKFGHEYVTGEGAFLIKYDRNGNVIWSVVPKSDTAANYTWSSSVAADISGNVYITGEFQDSLKFGTYELYSMYQETFIVKFDSSGNVLWAQQSTNALPLNFKNSCVATDASGTVYLSGSFTDSITFGSYAFKVTGSLQPDFFVIKFNPVGTIAWAKDATPTNGITGWQSYSVCTDDSNHIYISGGVGGGGLLPASFIFANDTVGITDDANGCPPSFLLKLDSSGNVLCSSTLKGGAEYGNSVTADSTGKFIYMGGTFWGAFAMGDDSLISNTGAVDPLVGRWQPCFQCDLIVNGNSQSQSICSGQSVDLSVIGGTNYTWSPAAGLNTTTGDSVIAAPSVTTTYNIYTSSGSCSDSGQIIITVIPVSPLNIFPPSPTLCKNLSDTLYVESNGNDFTWSLSLGLNTTTGSEVIASPTATVTYTVTGIDSLGCQATGTVTVNIIPIPNKPSFTQHNDTLISSAKYDNQWYLNNTILLGDTSQYLIITTVGNYYVEVNNEANGCSTSSDTTTITSLTGIEQLSFNNGQLTVYPNPFNNELFIKINSSAEDMSDWSMQLTDVLGRPLYSISPLNPLKGTFEIDLSDLPGGMYFITVIYKTGRDVVPVVKQN